VVAKTLAFEQFTDPSEYTYTGAQARPRRPPPLQLNWKGTIMNAAKWLYLGAAASALVLPNLVFGACSHSTEITNDSSVTMRIVEIKSSYSPPFFKSQWTGSRVIAPHATGTISWTSDLDCEDDSGVQNVFDVKFIRKIGQTHYCSGMRQSQAVRLEAPDSCFKN
jgi:hypothetical protein